MGLICNMLTARGDKYCIYLHSSSNNTHKRPLHAQVTSAVAWGHSRSHISHLPHSHISISFKGSSRDSPRCFPTDIKLQERRWWGVKASPDAFSSTNTVIHRSQDCSQQLVALQEESSSFYREFLGNGRRKRGSFLCCTRGKGPAPCNAWLKPETLSRAHRPSYNKLICALSPLHQNTLGCCNPDVEQGHSWGLKKTS